MGKYNVDGPLSGKSSNGCHCSKAVAVLSVLLLIAVAVGVGLIVYYAEKADDAESRRCGQSSGNTTLADCVALAGGKNEDICRACEASTTSTTTSITTTTPTTAAPPPKYPIRLPGSLSPVLYRLYLRPDFYADNQSDFNFNGSVSIVVTCLDDTSEIRLHSQGLQLSDDSIVVTEEGGIENLFDSFEMYKPSDLIIIQAKTPLAKGHNYTIEFTEFRAPIRRDFVGLFLGQFKQNSETVFHVATQMEPTFARMVFPCFDEPAMKAQFDVTLARKSHVTAISNMPIEESTHMSDGWVEDRFEITPVMPTYLLAFIIGDFTNTSTSYKGRFPISVWSRQEVAGERALALEIAPTLQEYFENLFGLEYDLPKIDMIGLQSFVFSAMENWGAMIFREQYLLYKEGSSLQDKFYVISFVAHEISHHWVGNLVSPAWWDDLWLNEAFAQYMEYVGVNAISPTWKPFDIFVTYVCNYAMPLDEKVSSHPIYVDGIETADDIFAVFDDIIYLKGGLVVRMLANLVGEDVFSKVLNKYITKHMYGSARHQDFWEAIQTEADIANVSVSNIGAMMGTWIYQSGFPTVHVQFTEEGRLRLTQSRYLKDRTATDPGTYQSDYGYKWDIPFTFTSSSEKSFDLPNEIILMNHTDDWVDVESDRVPSPRGDNWVIGNLQSLAFLQVNYDQRNWDAIIKQLKTNHTVIHSINRIQIVHDSWNLVKSGDLSLDTALRVSEYIRGEREYGPWFLLTEEWDYIARMLQGNQLLGRFRGFVREAISPAYKDFATESSDIGFSGILAKSTVLKHACRYGVPECMQYVSALFAAWMANPQDKPAILNTDLADAILCSAVHNGEAAEFDFLLEVYLNSSLQSDRTKALRAMACTQHLWLVARYTSLCFDEKKIAESDVHIAILSMTVNSNQPWFLWDWYRSNYDTLRTTLNARYATILSYLAKNFNTDIKLKELEQFVNEKAISEHPTIQNGVATVRANINWMEESVPIVQTWLTANNY